VYRLFVRNDRIKQEVDKAIEKMSEIDVAAPADLSDKVHTYLEVHQEIPWEVVVREIIDGKPSGSPVARKRARPRRNPNE
jgi:hypothetical protein